MAPQYPQKLRDEWLSEKIFKNWIVKLDDVTKARCKFCKYDIKAKKYDLQQQVKLKRTLKLKMLS